MAPAAALPGVSGLRTGHRQRGFGHRFALPLSRQENAARSHAMECGGNRGLLSRPRGGVRGTAQRTSRRRHGRGYCATVATPSPAYTRVPGADSLGRCVDQRPSMDCCPVGGYDRAGGGISGRPGEVPDDSDELKGDAWSGCYALIPELSSGTHSGTLRVDERCMIRYPERAWNRYGRGSLVLSA
jgi:hypothetical protein